jgi:glycosyltransferase involved in cell wall biosynthesis
MSPIAEKAQEMGIRDRVTFTGEIAPSDSAGDYQLPPDGVIRMYKMADAVAFPSLLETFGHVNIEAMAVERPIVSTDAPGCRDIVDHEINGLIAPAGEAGSLADQMQRIVESPELRSRLVKNGHRTVCEQYTWETVGDQYLQLYREIV